MPGDKKEIKKYNYNHAVITTVNINGEKVTISISKKGTRATLKRGKAKAILTWSHTFIYDELNRIFEKSVKAVD